MSGFRPLGMLICPHCGTGQQTDPNVTYVTIYCQECGKEMWNGEEGYVYTVPAPKAQNRGPEAVRDFWEKQSSVDLLATLKKLESYGSLQPHGQIMLTLVGRPHASMQEGTEIAIASYVAGKLNRIMEALSHGVLSSVDCWDDLACYAMMARYNRIYGGWP